MEQTGTKEYLLGGCEPDSIQLIGNGDVYSACVKGLSFGTCFSFFLILTS